MEMTFMAEILQQQQQQPEYEGFASAPGAEEYVGHWPSMWTAYRRIRRQHLTHAILSCCSEARCSHQAFAELCLV